MGSLLSFFLFLGCGEVLSILPGRPFSEMLWREKERESAQECYAFHGSLFHKKAWLKFSFLGVPTKVCAMVLILKTFFEGKSW